MPQRISGTREWAVAEENCIVGCEHDCRYCYAKYNAVEKFKTVRPGDWTNMVVDHKALNNPCKKHDGMVMFPTRHDITPSTLKTCIQKITAILAAGNQVLIVTKPHPEVISELCDEFYPYDGVHFRFTIGARDDKILEYWEPGAPCYADRMESLKMAFEDEFPTSISCEPMLDEMDIVALFEDCKPFVSDTFWIGKMNHTDHRVKVETDEDRAMLKAIEEGQTDVRIWEIYNKLRHEPKIRWKESIKKVCGLDLATEAGLNE